MLRSRRARAPHRASASPPQASTSHPSRSSGVRYEKDTSEGPAGTHTPRAELAEDLGGRAVHPCRPALGERVVQDEEGRPGGARAHHDVPRVVDDDARLSLSRPWPAGMGASTTVRSVLIE